MKLNYFHNNDLIFDPVWIKSNLTKKLSKVEFFSIAFVMGLTILFTIHHNAGYYQPPDFELFFMRAGSGDFSNFRFAYWIMPVFWFLEKLPPSIAFFLWTTINVLGCFFAGRVFGAKTWVALLSYQMVYVIYYGQITGILLAGLALAWLGMAEKKPHIAGFGFLLAATKPQFGLPIGFFLWLCARISWKDRIKSLIVPIVGVLLTFLAYPNWVQNIIDAIVYEEVHKMADISLWGYLGPWCLLFWLPPLLLKINPTQKLRLLILTATFATPYFQQTGLLVLYIIPFGWIPLITNIGYLFPILSWGVLKALVIVPLSLYSIILVESIINLSHKRSTEATE